MDRIIANPTIPKLYYGSPDRWGALVEEKVMTDANRLYYMRARYYDPKLKRFLNRDVIRGEIQDGQTFNRYAYVNGNPVSYIDPLGLMRCETGGTGNGDNAYKDDFAKEPFLPDEYYSSP
ncbi:RHS repeat-associated core domain-containing protein [Paenibacillus amylolyticus]|uniref:RHS repeat-associated core domain-containing protein n=1 Tax=Paenibacillus amylolyticus TaxID=1451 RepID=UPI003397A5C8